MWQVIWLLYDDNLFQSNRIVIRVPGLNLNSYSKQIVDSLFIVFESFEDVFIKL